MKTIKNQISYNEFITRKNKLYWALRNKTDTIENLKNQAKLLLEEVEFVYEDEKILDPKWLVNVSELREFYTGIEFNYDFRINHGYNPNDKHLPYRNGYINEKDYMLWDRLSNNGIYSIHDCDLEMDKYHISRIAHYNFNNDYSKTGVFQLRSLGILSHHFENNGGTYETCIQLASRYYHSFKIIKKYKYDLKYSKDLHLRKMLIKRPIKIFNKAYHRAVEAKNNRLQSIFYYHLMKSKELYKKNGIRYNISKYGEYSRVKARYESSYAKYISENIFGKPDYIVNLARYLALRFLRVLCGYGERPQNVVLSGLFTVLVFSPLYMLNGININGNVIDYKVDLFTIPSFNNDFLLDILNSLYFSMITFTTLGYGDASPIGFSKLFSSIESFFGAIFISLFIFTLARQVQR